MSAHLRSPGSLLVTAMLAFALPFALGACGDGDSVPTEQQEQQSTSTGTGTSTGGNQSATTFSAPLPAGTASDGRPTDFTDDDDANADTSSTAQDQPPQEPVPLPNVKPAELFPDPNNPNDH